MSHIADDKQIEFLLLDAFDNLRHGMTGNNMRFESDLLLLCLGTGVSHQFIETPLDFPFFLHHLIDAGWYLRQFLDGDHVQFAFMRCRQRHRSRKGFRPAWRTVMGDKYPSKHGRSPLPAEPARTPVLP